MDGDLVDMASKATDTFIVVVPVPDGPPGVATSFPGHHVTLAEQMLVRLLGLEVDGARC